MTKPSKPRKGKAGATAKPSHNAARPKTYATAADLAAAIGAEPRRATIAGREVTMSQAERLCRLIVEKAVAGRPPEVRQIIRMMIAHPKIAGGSKDQWLLVLAGADALL